MFTFEFVDFLINGLLNFSIVHDFMFMLNLVYLSKLINDKVEVEGCHFCDGVVRILKDDK
jgi:hypothetical protein